MGPFVVSYVTLSSLLSVAFSASMLRPANLPPFLDAMLAAEHEREARKINYMIEFTNETTACYSHIGCFTFEDTKEWGYLPKDPGTEGFNTMFSLYQRGDDGLPLELYFENKTTFDNIAALKKTYRTLYLISHGFTGNGKLDWVINMKDALLKLEDANVIVVDWSKGATFDSYNQAAANAMSAGRATAYLLSKIVQIYGHSPTNIHFIGFSLGAHVGGFAGRHFEKLSGHKLGRITALDAANPGFEGTDRHVKKDDSDFTVGVHTSAGSSIWTGKVGLKVPVGHIDFYVNGGFDQPGCPFYDLTCHHYRAHAYFIEAILNMAERKKCGFVARHCREKVDDLKGNVCTIKDNEIGMIALDSHGSGEMYVKTKTQLPFCIESDEYEDESSNIYYGLKKLKSISRPQ